ncbi:MAG: type II toxin-antitoxin system HicA family toxin [Cyanobacteria bacterium]|nr:type II toxin-antitoxin system HicA family toxin [Cyanobacteriota bacterium]
MGKRIRQMDAMAVEGLLKNYGFHLISQKGSHRKWRNDNRNLQVIVPMHRGRNLPIGTLRNILVQADIPDSDWKTEN